MKEKSIETGNIPEKITVFAKINCSKCMLFAKKILSLFHHNGLHVKEEL